MANMSTWCDDCGLCCLHMRTPPFVGREDPNWQALPHCLKSELEQWFRSVRIDAMDKLGEEDAPCLWLNVATGKCRYYNYRPSICREFEVGCERCVELRQMVGLDVSTPTAKAC